MKISAYIPCYNVAAYIEPAIRALLSQTRPPDELLIIDDGSTDRTLEIASHYPVRVIRHESNQGLAAGRNTAFANPRHELVAGYDLRFRTNFEDVDLGTRLLRAGYQLVFDPRAVAHHMRRDTVSSVVRTSWRSDFYNHYYSGGYNNIALKLLLNFRHVRVLVWRHLKSGKPQLLRVDARPPWFHSYWDLRYRFSRERLPAVVADAKAMDLYFPWPLRSLRRRFHSS